MGRGRSQAVDQSQDVREQPPWNRNLGKLKRDAPTMPDHLGAKLNQLLANSANVGLWL